MNGLPSSVLGKIVFGDPEALADRIKTLADTGAYKEMGLNGRRKVTEKYAPEQHFAKLKELFEN